MSLTLREILLPWFLSLIPVAGMLWVLGELRPPPFVSVLRIVAGLGAAVVLLAAALRLLRTSRGESPALSALCLWLALYPTAFMLGGSLSANHEVTFAVAYCLVGLAVAAGIGSVAGDRRASFMSALTLVAAVSAMLFLAVLFRTYVWPAAYPMPIQTAVSNVSELFPVDRAHRSRPDIVHLVLDSMGRRDVLEEYYGVEVASHVASLEGLGFAVDHRRAHANYTQTQLTFASMFNMRYLDELTSVAGATKDRRPLMALVANAVVPRLLKQIGYEVQMVSSGYRSSGTFASADRCDCPQLWFADAEFGVLSLTPFLAMAGGIGERAHYDRAGVVFDSVAQFQVGPSPTYLFAHVPMPHPPFLVTEGGEFVSTNLPASGRDGSNFAGSHDDYRRGYRMQAKYALARAVAAAEAAIRRSDERGRNLVFVISGDHGPRLGFDVQQPKPSSAAMALPVFLAVRMRDLDEGELPRSLVNVYRTVFRHELGVPLQDLPNRALLSGFSTPYVGERIEFDGPTAISPSSPDASAPPDRDRP